LFAQKINWLLDHPDAVNVLAENSFVAASRFGDQYLLEKYLSLFNFKQ
jgi:hypothetical protein